MKLNKGFVLKNGSIPYIIEETLGSGGFGITYKASAIINSANGPEKRVFAIKEHFIKEWCERDNNSNLIKSSTPLQQRVDDGKRDFIAEAQHLSQINHPNIIKVYELFEENNTAYYVMEYIEGENLNDFILNNGIMSINSMLDFFSPICNAVETLHVNKMTHLDIKPANIMLKKKGKFFEPILIDFGLAKHYDENGNATSTIRLQGYSDGYAPVEQYVGIDKFSPQSDVYSLAATMLFCISGQKPPKASEVNNNTLFQLFPHNTPQNVVNAITHAMNPIKEARTPSINHLVYELYNTIPNNTISGNKLVWFLTPIIFFLVTIIVILAIYIFDNNDEKHTSNTPTTNIGLNTNSPTNQPSPIKSEPPKAMETSTPSSEKNTPLPIAKTTTPTNTEPAQQPIVKTTNSEEAPKKVETPSQKPPKKTEKRYPMVINDPDGFTNIRSQTNAQSRIVDQVYEGDVFYVSKIPGSNWRKFYWTEDGSFVGYIHNSRIVNAW